jgi:hypothetical protein
VNFDKYGGRRYLLCWGALISATALQWFGKLDLAGVAYGLAVGGTVGAYITGNVIQKKNEGATNAAQ